MANILAGTLVELARDFAPVRPGGQLVMAGILEEQVHEVRAGFAARLDTVVMRRARWMERADRHAFRHPPRAQP